MDKKLPVMIYTMNEFKLLFEEFDIKEDKVRFYIGKSHLGPKAFGIYKQDDDYIVYKVKANGEVAIRYKGPDEEKAVYELYTKFLDEVANRPWLRKYHPDSDIGQKKESAKQKAKKKKQRQAVIGGTLIVAGLISLLTFGIIRYDRVKYYKGNDGTRYCKYRNSYYCYNPIYDDWYWYSDFYDEDWIETEDYGEASDFYYSDYYEDHFDNDSGSDYDSDWDWDSSDWGSDSYTDWDSDW